MYNETPYTCTLPTTIDSTNICVKICIENHPTINGCRKQNKPGLCLGIQLMMGLKRMKRVMKYIESEWTVTVTGFKSLLPESLMSAPCGDNIRRIGAALESAGLVGTFLIGQIMCDQRDEIPGYGRLIKSRSVGSCRDWPTCRWDKFEIQALADISRYQREIENWVVVKEVSLTLQGRTAGYYLHACPGSNLGDQMFVPSEPEVLAGFILSTVQTFQINQDSGPLEKRGWHQGVNRGSVGDGFVVVVNVDIRPQEEGSVTKEHYYPLPNSNLRATNTTYHQRSALAELKVRVWGNVNKKFQPEGQVEVARRDLAWTVALMSSHGYDDPKSFAEASFKRLLLATARDVQCEFEGVLSRTKDKLGIKKW